MSGVVPQRCAHHGTYLVSGAEPGGLSTDDRDLVTVTIVDGTPASLPRTGVDTGDLTRVALALLAAGAVLVVGGRRAARST